MCEIFKATVYTCISPVNTGTHTHTSTNSQLYILENVEIYTPKINKTRSNYKYFWNIHLGVSQTNTHTVLQEIASILAFYVIK